MEAVYQSWLKRFEQIEQHLNSLDAATGDGDHGTTMVKGLRAAAADPDAAVKAFRKAAGGASGSLFSILIGSLEKVMKGEEQLPVALAAAAARITQMGQAVAGDKTLLDALIPASLESTMEAAVQAALTGCENTIPMVAKRGRAKYVEGAGVGHVDAGATSVVELLTIFSQTHSSRSDTPESHSSGPQSSASHEPPETKS